MAHGERTYSFRGPPELADRLLAARRRLPRMAEPGTERVLRRELEVALARRLRAAPELARDQSAFMRAAVEMLVGVTEKAAADREIAVEYATAREEDGEAAAFISGALETSSRSWHEE